MPRRALVAAALLVACGTPEAKHEARPEAKNEAKPEAKPAQKRMTLEGLEMTLPAGWTSSYRAEWDTWGFTTPPIADGRTASARIERAPANAVASPEAFLHQRLRYWDPGTTAEIETRAGVKDGFAMTVVVKPAAAPNHPKRETYVVRQLGNVWYQCMSEWVPDDAIRDQLIALCSSLKLR